MNATDYTDEQIETAETNAAAQGNADRIEAMAQMASGETWGPRDVPPHVFDEMECGDVEQVRTAYWGGYSAAWGETRPNPTEPKTIVSTVKVGSDPLVHHRMGLQTSCGVGDEDGEFHTVRWTGPEAVSCPACAGALGEDVNHAPTFVFLVEEVEIECGPLHPECCDCHTPNVGTWDTICEDCDYQRSMFEDPPGFDVWIDEQSTIAEAAFAHHKASKLRQLPQAIRDLIDFDSVDCDEDGIRF